MWRPGRLSLELGLAFQQVGFHAVAGCLVGLIQGALEFLAVFAVVAQGQFGFGVFPAAID
ncbi:hypothetical protein D3C80_2009170 [compost metagenome]